MDLSDRMKSYEGAFRETFEGNNPIMVRVDGKAFHTYTRDCVEPFDIKFHEAMDEAAKALCSEIQGAVMAYVQSDEISVLINPRKSSGTMMWFDGNIQKIISVTAAIASTVVTIESRNMFDEIRQALFDSRAFELPVSELANYFIWRQSDALRNSVQSMARSVFSHKALNGKSNAEMRQMLADMGSSWDAVPVRFQRGRTVIRYRMPETPHTYVHKKTGEQISVNVSKAGWAIDAYMPLLVENKAYVDDRYASEDGIVS